MLLLGLLVLSAGGCTRPGPAPPTTAPTPTAGPAISTALVTTPTPSRPVLSAPELLQEVFEPGAVPGQPYNRLLHANPIDWPPMRYLHESARVGDHTLTPTAVRLVPGEPFVRFYAPQIDSSRPAEHLFERDWWSFNRPATIPVIFIPPGAALVMVYLEFDPSAGHWDPEIGSVCDTPDDPGPNPGALLLSYPGLGDHPLVTHGPGCTDTFCPYNLEEFTQPPRDCPGSGWYSFYLPALEIDPDGLWLIYATEHDLLFWTLTVRP
jgi:hypothetical protein